MALFSSIGRSLGILLCVVVLGCGGSNSKPPKLDAAGDARDMMGASDARDMAVLDVADAPIDAPSLDAADAPGDGGGDTIPGCGSEGSGCMVGGNAGLCIGGTCVACTDSTDDDACKGAYGSNRLCIGGACIVAACRGSTDCPAGQVCKANQCAACVDMTDDALCGAGKLCLSGACAAGDCRTNAACQTGKLCKSNLCANCTDPADDAACETRYGAGNICNAGTCKPGCRAQSDCTGGQLCKANVCAACAAGDDATCVMRYGATSVCAAGVCTQGTCAMDSGCGGGTLCQTAACAACADPADDTRCATRYGAGYMCIAGSCQMANCRADATCASGQLCKSNLCAPCVDTTDDAACAARYGAGNICKAGMCTAGCRTDAACASGQLCAASNTCAACVDPGDDAACAARYGAGNICKAGMCTTGCRTDAACSGTQLCKSTVCAACADPADDGACSTRYGEGNICKAGACGTGCRTAPGCVGNDTGKLCTTLICTACTQDAAGDTACATQYAQPRVCVSGACVVGNCRSSADCTGGNAGKQCVNNQCVACTSNASCQGDATYGAATICHVAAGPNQGQCVSDTCTTASQSCPANPSVNFCCPGTSGNRCLTGNCCVQGDCSFGQICTSNQCVQCTTVSDGNYFVDPKNGSDTVGITGSATCAWRSIGFALAQLAGSAQPATINVKATADVAVASGEVFPIGIATALMNGGGTVRIVPANRTIRGAGTDVPTIKVPTGNYGFTLAAPDSRLSQMIIEPADTSSDPAKSNHAIRVLQGSTSTTVIDHITARSARLEGIRVERTGTGTASGVLTINGGVTVTAAGSGAGLRVFANGRVTITGGAGPDVVRFLNNAGWGIFVQDRGSIAITGSATYPVAAGGDEGTVIVKGNASGGIGIAQCISDLTKYINTTTPGGPALATGTGNCAVTFAGLADAPPLNTLDGVAIWNHTGGTLNGLSVGAGSQVKLRNSVILGNARTGVSANNGPAVSVGDTYTVFDLSSIDLGKAGDPGRNRLQVAWGAGAPVNGGAGIQVAITNNRAQTLSARGNRLQDYATSGVNVDCESQAVGVSHNVPITTCFNGDPIHGISVCGNLTGATPNVLDVAVCTIP